MEHGVWELLEKLVSLYGGVGLAIVSFLAATILPFSSEAALVFAVVSGMPVREAVLWASFGNCCACMFNYSFGVWFRSKVESRIKESPMYSRIAEKMKTGGHAILLFSFLPVVGDPITILSGFFGQRISIFIATVFTLRIVRYIVLAVGFS
ncbi:DedA family protein [Leptospira gomenensis]|uniref:DedA family protein n=1 Tax=Leptospira gomenensis TaxID=2484974 RepID=A0A5F1YHD1_9LEPT|nr:DedA family protein [Leptospira gomenensis]TGK32623.1 DedA family protein [Leptospira gomenensis]TGK38499.1 DedA family protein [Leptospira gomenensis]TGK52258.1 DedA family protein [Leptospira gomenensis]TGK59921.1 DedA family protein [Leptospira gomenensis]